MENHQFSIFVTIAGILGLVAGGVVEIVKHECAKNFFMMRPNDIKVYVFDFVLTNCQKMEHSIVCTNFCFKKLFVFDFWTESVPLLCHVVACVLCVLTSDMYHMYLKKKVLVVFFFISQ